MDAQDYRNLQEAYTAVYAPQEVDEGLRSAVKRLFGGGKKEAEPPKPESRGEQLRKKYNVGPEKSDTSAKMKILDRSRARAERDERDYGGSKYSKSVAQKSKEAHDRYLRAGYSKYSANVPTGSGNRARRRAAALSTEEFEFIVNSLVKEGYDLSSYTWDEMYDICLNEAVRGEDPERRRALAAERKKGIKPLSVATGEKYANRQISQMAYAERGRMGEELDIFNVVLEYLLNEGYADTNENALAIMSNMSEEWRESIVDEAYQEPRFNRKHYLKKLSTSGGMGMGTPEDSHGYRDPKMAKVGAEFSKRKTAAVKAKKTGEPDSYRAEKEAQSKYRK